MAIGVHREHGVDLAPHLDALFNGGWITFTEMGEMIVTPSLDASVRDIYMLSDSMKISGLRREQLPYLEFHRTEVVRRLVKKMARYAKNDP